MMPDRTGGLPSYAVETYKDFGPGVARHVGGVSAWAYGLGWFPVAPINMILAASYIASCGIFRPDGVHADRRADQHDRAADRRSSACRSCSFPATWGSGSGPASPRCFGIVSMVPITLLVFLPFFRPATLHWANSRVSPWPIPARRQLLVLTSAGSSS